MHVFC